MRHSGPKFSDAFEVLSGLEIRTFRTLRDLILRPVRVGREALAGDREQYLGQGRLFLLLVAVQTLVFSLTRFYEFSQAQDFLGNHPGLIQAYSEQLAMTGHSLDDVNNYLRDWFNLLFAPFGLFAALLVGGLFKVFDRRYTYLGHVLLYLTISNAATIVSIPFSLLQMFGALGFMAYGIAVQTILILIASLFVWHFYAKSLWNGIAKVIATIAGFIVISMIIGLLLWVILNTLADWQFGQSPINFLFENVDQFRTQTPKGTP